MIQYDKHYICDCCGKEEIVNEKRYTVDSYWEPKENWHFINYIEPSNPNSNRVLCKDCYEDFIEYMHKFFIQKK